ncbi:LysE family translocator [Pseudochrobactrum saccharolyticum]|uniref:LysE family translocator n=1 Tax=Pseudochrobactrum saccharolyticum TaxID=354352 RepID=UPI002754A0CF|nr:LysE family transporter [Pseudochrobactrum saccharolyticum]MDP8252385.1 LysE family transporter [Pseudochrobactrum saccharolyticum]
MQYVIEFTGLMAVFVILLVAPGADFALIVRQSIVHGRRAAFITSLGIGASLMFHISYTILGIGLIVSQSLFLFSLIKWAGAAYLFYLGIKALREKPLNAADADKILQTDGEAAQPQQKAISAKRCFTMGFITNALNPKAVLFFLSLFSSLVSHETPAAIQGIYGILIAIVVISWFAIVTLFFTLEPVRKRFFALGAWFNRVTGMVFIGLGIKLASQQAH